MERGRGKHVRVGLTSLGKQQGRQESGRRSQRCMGPAAVTKINGSCDCQWPKTDCASGPKTESDPSFQGELIGNREVDNYN